MSVAQTGTYANRTTPLYAPLSSSAENWYKYPAANGQIIMQDASGSQILQAIGTDLFYDGQLLAKSDDIETIDAWSDYPVINPAGVNFDGNPLVDASTITATGDISGGGALTVGGSIVGGANITVPGDISGGALAVTGSLSGSAVTVTGAIQGGSLLVSTLPKPIAPGEIQGDSLSVSGAAAVGSVSSTGAIAGTTITGSGAVQGASLTTTGGLDMTNSAITRATSVNISNAGFAPYGQLTSPNGTQLLWNGASVSTGAAGDVSQWANFQAVAPILGNGQPISNLASVATTGTVTAGGNITTTANVNGFAFNGTNVEATNIAAGPIGSGKFCIMTNNSITSSTTDGLTISVPSNNLVTTVANGNMTNTATGIINNVGNNFEIIADAGLNPLVTPNIDLTSKNGNGGQVNIKASPGSVLALGGVVNVVAEGGTVTIPQPPPELPISVTVGGELNLTATTGSGAGLYTATSAINLNAAGINIYSGAIPPFGSVLGYTFIYSNLGTNICSGLPSAGFQLPFTTYIYGTGVPLSYGGVRIQSPNGIQMLSDTYMTRLYPLDTDGLTIGGRSFLGTANVFLEDVETLTAVAGSGQVKTDLLNSVGGAGIAYLDNLYPATGKGLFANFLKPNMATATGTPNLTISGNASILGGFQNYVEIQNADVIAFDPAASGSLTGVKNINGIPYPPPAGLVEDWSTYKAVSALDISGFDIGNVVTINGAPYPPAGPDDWYNIPAGANVDISGFDLNNVNNLTMPDNGVIVSAGQLSIFADSGKNLNIATNGGGDLNLGTGNASDINITTGGTGNDLVLAGDTVRMTGTVGVEVNGTLDLVTNNIINVTSITTDIVQGETNLTVRADGTGDLTLSTAAGVVNVISPGIGIIINSGASGNTTIDANNIILTPDNEIQMLGPVAVGTAGAPQTVTVTGSVTATGDVTSSFGGSTPYSLNAIGAAVNGVQQYDYYVAVNGSNTTGTGSVLRPFATITGALAATLSISDAIPININVAAGTYTESPTVTRNNTFLVGNVGVADAVIIGTLTFDPTATGTVSQGMAGISVVGNVVCSDALSFDINWYFQYCNITSYGTAALNAFSTGSGNNSLFINNTVVSQNVTANATITLNSVRLNAVQCQINNTTTGACISSNGTGSMSLFGCTLTAAGAATASALITFINAVSNGTASSFNLNTFTYTAATAGAAKAAFFFNNAGSLAGSTVINNNVFNLPGAAALIQRPGAGSIAIAWGANTSSILTIPAAGTGLTYAYTTSTPLRANVLYDSTSSAGTANQVLGAGSAGGTLTWRSLTNQSLGSIPAATNAAVYQNQPLFYNTATQSINYIAAGDDVIVQPCPASANPVASQRGITYIATSAAGGANFQFANGGGLTANDAGWYIYIKNGNPNAGGDITLTGALVSGNTVIHQGTALQNGGITILTWTGTAYVAY